MIYPASLYYRELVVNQIVDGDKLTKLTEKRTLRKSEVIAGIFRFLFKHAPHDFTYVYNTYRLLWSNYKSQVTEWPDLFSLEDKGSLKGGYDLTFSYRICPELFVCMVRPDEVTCCVSHELKQVGTIQSIKKLYRSRFVAEHPVTHIPLKYYPLAFRGIPFEILVEIYLWLSKINPQIIREL